MFTFLNESIHTSFLIRFWASMAIAIKIYCFVDLPTVGATALRADRIYILSAFATLWSYPWLKCDLSASSFITRILWAANISWEHYTFTCDPNPSRERSTHQCWCFLITFISRIYFHRCGTSSSQASSDMYTLGVIITFEPFGALKFLHNSLKFFLLSVFPFARK